MKTIQLPTNRAHFKFRVNLGDSSCNFRVNWLERFGYFSVDIDADGERVASGRALNSGVDLLEGTGIAGRLVLEGKQPTPGNLNVDNHLRYYDE